MKKEDILAKSRAENMNGDEYEKEVGRQAHATSTIVMLVLVLIFFLVELFAKDQRNWGLWALICGANSSAFWVKYRKLHHKVDLLVAIGYGITTLLMSGMHIYNLVTSSAPLT